ncbi:exosortase [Thioclava dalianensis]|uniref:Exosortase n=1 Tax=Thioclava dalianensis TaxID=1185766 RepID=A0A074TRH2_9RHOB|nr:polysaccharide pyruvyl transferase family protein [Thioclava dalianensis]KEP71573.1 exosortase [Thioclava dalianensis]SFN44293.1 Polysaccharide pyruvyl transferase [Thioclava dalianensis]
MTAPLRAYWWKDTPNFGDAIGARIVAHVSGRSVEWAPMAVCDLLCIGSVLGFRPNGKRLSGPFEGAPYVWGSGILDHRLGWLAEGRISAQAMPKVRAVRGALTALHLSGFEGVFGDPGLLAPLVEPSPATRKSIGLIPHIKQWDDADTMRAFAATGHRIIDVRDPDPWAVVRAIAECEAVVSTSLHGLIVADAYGIPNAWIAGAGRFKFHDYFYSVGRNLRAPLSLSEAVAQAEAGQLRAADPAVVAQVQADLVAAFPDALRAAPAEQSEREGALR